MTADDRRALRDPELVELLAGEPELLPSSTPTRQPRIATGAAAGSPSMLGGSG